MNRPVVIRTLSVPLDAETWGRLERAANVEDVSVENFAADAIRAASEEWSEEFEAFVQVGLDDIAAGRSYTQAEMAVWFADRRDALKAKGVQPDADA